MRLRSLLLLLMVSSLAVSALDHFYALRGGIGFAGMRGKDVPENTKIGLSGSVGAVGATAFYPAGPLWGTDLNLTTLNIKKDTVLWSDATGDYTDSTDYNFSFTHVSIGLFLMKSWDFGLNIYTGPMGSYLVSCVKTVAGSEEQCDDDYQPFQLEAEIGAMQQVSERILVEIRYLQTVLPFDKEMRRHEFTYAAHAGLLFQF